MQKGPPMKKIPKKKKNEVNISGSGGDSWRLKEV